jgi:SAM-dependent methyltransferase
MTRDWDVRADELSTRAIAAGEPTAWFDRLYSAAEAGEVSMPWDRDAPHALLEQWAGDVRGQGRRAVVVGSGLGADAEYLARRGSATTGFDVAPTAVRLARERHPGTSVDYRVADLLDLPRSGSRRSTWSWRSSPSGRCPTRHGQPRCAPYPGWSHPAAFGDVHGVPGGSRAPQSDRLPGRPLLERVPRWGPGPQVRG